MTGLLMPTRYKTYELMPGVFGTYDTQTEELPTEFIGGPYDVNIQEAEFIEQGGSIEIVDGEAIVSSPVLEGEVL